MRRGTFTILLALAVAVPGAGSAGSSSVPQAAVHVRSAIPAIEAYRADRGTYVGLTLAKIRSYDRSVRSVTVKRASKTRYCVQSTIRGPVVHFDGPRGPVRRGRCGVRGAVVPPPPGQQPPPPPTGDAAEAQSRLRAAVPAIEAYAADNDGYAGMTLEKIRTYDYGVQGITVVWALRAEYCIESTVGAETFHQHGPANGRVAGACPAAP
jgi:hypothetical protein